MREHWADVDDAAHIELESGIEHESDDAYFDAEMAFLESKCEEVIGED